MSNLLFNTKISFLLWKSETSTKLKRFFHCCAGHHEVYSHSEAWVNSLGKRLQCSYVGCRNCGYLFFPSKHYKKKYKRIQESKTQLFKNLFDEMRSEKE